MTTSPARPTRVLLAVAVAVALLAWSPPASAQVAIDWVSVGYGHACDAQPGQGCFGSVAATYRISKFEISNDRYAAFLNAVAATDTHGLYSVSMGSVPSPRGERPGGTGASAADVEPVRTRPARPRDRFA